MTEEHPRPGGTGAEEGVAEDRQAPPPVDAAAGPAAGRSEPGRAEADPAGAGQSGRREADTSGTPADDRAGSDRGEPDQAGADPQDPDQTDPVPPGASGSERARSDQAGWADSAGLDSAGSGAGGPRDGDEAGTGARPPATDGSAIPRRRRISAAGAVIGLLLGLLGFALVVQLRSNATDEQLSTERPEDLVRILSDLDARKDRLSQEISQQQSLQQQLAAGSQSRQAALAEASQRADELGILGGTLAATGPGLRVEFSAAGKAIRASDVLDAVEELRGAGAEAMQITGQDGTAVRIIASTSFADGAGGALTVDGRALGGPYTITVIGDPQTMQIALKIPSGVVDTVQHNGGTVSVVAPGTVQVTALHQNTPPSYAKPVG
jgi:uncharacterized protein YlxW (UPF0749 family)